ncbi:IS66 family insertion sequence element accessory protein TnpB [Thioclava sp. JE_KL1]|uniref:IS66 family insertion sequence element accessory protein TnpB n=1 Tax=Thioclava TaxID=285107 RepID=UPI000C641D4B|nr:hypothetical protein [Thioclava sp.]MPQ95834.1 transposase [Thioclava sp. JE_KL1]
MVRGAQAFRYTRRFKIYLATQPVDIRTGIDGLVNSVSGNFDLDPFSRGFFVFRLKERDKISFHSASTVFIATQKPRG